MAAHPAFAANGPLKERLDLTVEDQGECEGWPCEVAWTDPEDGEEYLYRYDTVSTSRGRDNPRPVYRYVPTVEI